MGELEQTAAYDIEYRLEDDDAWYSVAVALSDDKKTLSIAFEGLDERHRISAGDFKTIAEVDDLFLKRFRPVSKQIQDNECHRVVKGMTVCAALTSTTDDLRYYDAVIDEVDHQEHSFADGEEECLCSFLICWLHGPIPGRFAFVKIGDICAIQTAALDDPKITSFSNLTKEGIPLTCLESAVTSAGREVDLGLDRDSDEDMGGSDSINSGGCYFLLLDNLEKDLSTSEISQFILGNTLVSPRAYLFPCKPSMPSCAGAIASYSKENIRKIHDFLVHSERLIVSASGRPWVVYDEVFDSSSGAILGGLLSQSQDKFQRSSLKQELKVVHSGTEAYDTAKQLRDLFLEFLNHEQLLYQRLVLKEIEIMKSSKKADTITYI